MTLAQVCETIRAHFPGELARWEGLPKALTRLKQARLALS